MKKLLAIILSVALVISVLVLPTASVSFATSAQDLNELQFEEPIEVFEAKLSNRAIRTKELSDGTIGAVYYKSGKGIYYGESFDGGITFKNFELLIDNATDSILAESVETSKQVTLAKEYVTEESPYGRGRLEAQNPNLIQLDDGNIMVLYRYNTYTSDPTNKPWSIYYSSICYQILDKTTGEWSDVKIMVENTKEKALDSAESDYGFWEPDPVYITDAQGNKSLIVYYADTATPNNLATQHIMGCVYDGEGFGAPIIMQNGLEHYSRDGMSVVTKLSDGSYAMVFESTKTSKDDTEDYITFVIKMSFSKDGISWSDPIIVAKPAPLEEPTPAGENAVCAAPYVVTLPDGRLAISYQTTDRYTGMLPNRVSFRIGTQVAVSSVAITYDTFAQNEINDDVTATFANKYNPGTLAANEFSKSASLMVKDNRLYVYYSVGENTLKDNAVKNNFGAINVAYMNLPVATENFASLEDYLVYQKSTSGTAPAEADGKITVSAADTINLIAGSGELVDDRTNPLYIDVDGIYSADSYTGHNTTHKSHFSFDDTAKTATASATAKIMYTTGNFRGMKISSVLQGRLTDGYMQSGYILNMQPDTLTAATYNSGGYVVFLRRQTATLNKLELVIRYCDSTGTAKFQKAHSLSTALDTTVLDYKFRFDAQTDEENIILNAYLVAEDGTETKLGETVAYPIDYTATSASAPIYNSGTFALITNGATTFEDFSVKKLEYPQIDTRVFDKATDLKAHGVFTMLETPATMYAGFDFRVQSAAAVTRGIEGYAIKLHQKADTDGAGALNLELSVYGTKDDGTEYANLKSYSQSIAEVLTDTTTSAGAKMIMDATVIGKTLSVTVTNFEDENKTITKSFDLSAYTKYDEYASGGFGIYKHGTGAITVEDLSFEILPPSVNNIDSSAYTLYTPDGNEPLNAVDSTFVSNNAETKKAILNGAYVTDFEADATFEIGSDGSLKSGIVFRVQDVGNATDDIEGYAVTAFKTVGTTNNNGRIVLCLYKWARSTSGKMAYLGTIATKPDTTTFESVYPEAENNILNAAGAKIKLNVKAEGNTVTSSFDVYDKNNAIAASSDEAVFDLTKEITAPSKGATFNEEAHSTVYNGGMIGFTVSNIGKVCDFNVYGDSLGISDTDISNATTYVSKNTLTVDSVNDKFVSTTTGHKQGVISGINTTDFDVRTVFKSTSAGATYNMAFDFAINETTHSGICAVGSSTAYMFEGYRIQLTKVSNTNANPSHTNLRLYKFEKDGESNKRTELENVANADFFADYEKYGSVEVVLEAKLIDGTLTAKAYVKEYPTRTISFNYTDEALKTAKGAVGCYIEGGGSVTFDKLRIDNAVTQKINVSDCENGYVYSTVNSGMAINGAAVKVNPVATTDGYLVDKVYATVGGEAIELPYTADGYLFTKENAVTEISASFGQFKIGDIDKNGSLQATDLAKLRKDILEIEYYHPSFTDCNGDGVVDVRDIVNLKSKIAE